jgi:hypothetical protein
MLSSQQKAGVGAISTSSQHVEYQVFKRLNRSNMKKYVVPRNVGWIHLQSIDHVDLCFGLIFVPPRSAYVHKYLHHPMTSLQRNPSACPGRLMTRLLHFKEQSVDVSGSAFAAPLAI